jgi:hypothetical protein
MLELEASFAAAPRSSRQVAVTLLSAIFTISHDTAQDVKDTTADYAHARL